MNDSVLVPVTDLGPTVAALNHALTLEGNHEITVLQVHPIVEREGSVRKRVMPEAIDERREAGSRTAERVFEKATSYADEHDVTIRTATTSGKPADRISAYAATHDIDRIVIGTRNQSFLSRVLQGSLPEAVMRESSVPVTGIEATDDDSSTTVGSVERNRPLEISRGIN